MGVEDYHYFPQIEKCEELEEYFERRKRNHAVYCHYTSLRSINSILDSNTIYISSIKVFNDKNEISAFGDENTLNKYYSLCFSTGVNENLSLWYLYSGINGKGGRIQLSYNFVKKLINESEYKICEFDIKNKKIDENGFERELIPEKDMTITFNDVLYSRESDKNNGFCDMKYNNLTSYDTFSIEEYQKYVIKHPGFAKTLIWYYEKESRILITLNDSVFQQLDSGKTYVVTAKLSENVRKNIKIRFAPEITDIDKEITENSYDKIKEFLIDSSGVSLSRYKGDIEMRLFDEDKHKEDLKKKICSECEYTKKDNEENNK